MVHMNWDIYDYLAGSVLILGALLAYLAVWKMTARRVSRTLALVAILLLLGLVWAQLAVGLI